MPTWTAISKIIVADDVSCAILGVNGSGSCNNTVTDYRIGLDKKEAVRPEPRIISPRSMPEGVTPVISTVDVKGLPIAFCHDVIVVSYPVDPAIGLDIPSVDMVEMAMINPHV